jgi:CRP/FNR family transcriptional regulator
MTNYSLEYNPDNQNFNNSFFNFLSKEEVQLLMDHSNMVHYRKNDNIFLQRTLTSHIMFVKSGLVKIYREGRMGKTVILNLETSGNFVGLMSVFGKEIHEFSASAIEPSDILFFDINIFKQILKNNGEFATFITHLVSINGLMLFDRLMAQTYKQLPGRIADVLLYFSEVIYKNTRFSFPLTRRELAELAGTTKESFIRTLTEFKHDKIIELDGSEVEIKSSKIVKTLSELG